MGRSILGRAPIGPGEGAPAREGELVGRWAGEEEVMHDSIGCQEVRAQ